MQTCQMTLSEIHDLAYDALLAAGTTPDNARYLAQATADTEADGVASHGLAYIPIYCEHVQCGKVDGKAQVIVSQPKPGTVVVDAAHGFAHPAIEAGLDALAEAARTCGIAVLSIKNSYNCGVLGVHTARIARLGLLALGATNAPASIAPSGGAKPVVGTNPFSMATPDGEGGVGLLIDQSASVIAKSEVMKHNREGQPIPLGWALDSDGQPTTDAAAGLAGSMAPAGDYKGVGLALIVEVLAAALSGSNLGTEASPFSGAAGGPPGTGQCFIAIDPSVASNAAIAKIARLIETILDQPNARLPGQNRSAKRELAQQQGVAVNQATIDKVQAVIAG